MTNEEIKTYNLEEWKTEGKIRFGENIMKWKFKCPMCGHITSIQEFKDAGAKSPDCAYSECIGRYTGKGSPKEGDSSGCNWCNYGFFGIPHGGILVDGHHIFDFADEQ